MAAPTRNTLHVERLHDRAGGLAAGDDEAAHAGIDECGGDGREGALDELRPRVPRRARTAPRRPRFRGAVA